MSRPGLAVLPANRWLLLILLLIAGFLAFSSWTFYRAARDSSAVIDRDYYSHGLRFNQTLLEQKAAATLGWHLQFELAGRRLQVALKDQNQRTVRGAQGVLSISSGPQGEPLRFPVAEARDGIYFCLLPDTLGGEQVVQIDFEHHGAALSKRLLLALP